MRRLHVATRSRVFPLCLVTLCCLAATPADSRRWADPMRAVPSRVVWAWERPEQLTSIDVRTTAVAVLDRTIQFNERGERVRYRQQPLHVSAGATLIAVVRLEGDAVTVDESVRARIVDAAVAAARRPEIRALQIDFDATLSQRQLYRELLDGIRAAVPVHMPLSITALTSWCADSAWLDTLPVDETVPMAFQMGPDSERVRAMLSRGEAFHSRRCRESIGVSTDEPIVTSRFRRVYVFNPRSRGRGIAGAVIR